MFEDIAAMFPEDVIFQYILKVNPRSLTLDYWTGHFELEFVKEWAAEFGMLFDFGCGMGCMTTLYKRSGRGVFGYDESKAMIEVARRNGPEVEFYSEFPERTDYDSVWMSHVVEHIPEDEYKGLFKRFKKDVPILISVPQGYAYDDGSGFHIHHWDTAEDLSAALQPYVRVEWAREFPENSVLRAQVWPKLSRRSARSTKDLT